MTNEDQMRLDELRAFIEAKKAQGYREEDIVIHVIQLPESSETNGG